MNIDIEEEETISVDDECDESDDEGPHSWPGRNSSPAIPSNSFAKSIGQVGTQFTHPIPSRAALPPLILKSPPITHQGLSIPTLFTIVPSGLVQPPSAIKTFLPQTSPVTTLSPQAETTTPILVPESPMKTQTPVHPPNHLLGNSAITPMKQSPQLTKCATTLAAIPPEEMTPAYHELKGFAESFKTKRIQLGYTQGAVGQSLADRGYSNFAQSTISRFEQMQLSPSNAAAIKVVLERWLLEADNPEAVTSTTLDPLGPPRKRKKRAVFSTQTRELLEDYFRKEARPNRQIIETIANDLGLLPEEVRVWFCNKRQKLKFSDDGSVDDPKSSPSSPASNRCPSPPRTKFTIEELSKSSATTPLSFTSSPVCFTSAFTMSSQPRLSSVILPTGNAVTVASPQFLLNNLVTKA